MNNLETSNSNGFALQPADMTDAMKMAEMLAKSNMVPKNYKNQPGDTLVAMMMGSELGLNPIQSLQNIAVINGRPCIWGDALLALVQNHPSFGSIVETFDNATMTATCTVTRKGSQPHTQTYSKEDAITARLWEKQGTWQQYPKRMLAMRARGFALRNQFADALLGLITAEEAEDYPDDGAQLNVVDITPKNEAIEAIVLPACTDEKFNARFSEWEKLILDGKKTAEAIISTVNSKATLSDEQIKKIKAVQIANS